MKKRKKNEGRKKKKWKWKRENGLVEANLFDAIVLAT